MAESVYVNFPSQAVPDLEKMSSEYGLKVARAIEQEWFKDSHSNRYNAAQRNLGCMLEESNLYRNIKMNYLLMVIYPTLI